ncbi:protein translocase subunit SecF [Nocardioides sp. KIGAM211]|uniref:Protein-export membrane protein SecF n=1 Tax=Nocardioides luti TaxID=2761101 RepID=A0A7X0VCY6_9ACTN|nr:protein translocase subunit SecF [Nocardioides luti]MBB6629517.1 protein translocase subunit SecF [Nocardioides luti]
MGKFSRLGNDLYNGRRSIDFIGRKWIWYAVSGVIVLLAVIGLSTKGLNMGIEFTGGAQYQVTTSASQDTADKLQKAVADTGIPSAASPIVTTAGTDSVIIQTEPLTEEENSTVIDAIVGVTGADPTDDISQSEIGASWGKDVAKRSIIGLVVFLFAVVLFIWAYFREWKMSVAAIVALAHDLIITVGIYALSGFEVTPATVTGVLTILGFSLYDTVVVFDKVRENTKNLRDRRTTYAAQANLAVNQTLVRSVNTSIVALIPVGAILYVGAVQLGSGPLKDLALALFVGMAAGAYSSIFIATPLLVQLKSNESEVKLAEKRDASRKRHEADRYASVPVFKEDMPLVDEPGERERGRDDEDGTAPVATAPPRRPEASGRGRIAPPARGPVRESGASGRVQPTRQTRSKRGKK